MDLTRPVEALIPGAQGRVLEALARTTGELTLRALSEVAHVSPPQASRVLRRLVGLGVVERRDVPPAALFRLAPENLAARLVSELAGLREAFLEELRQAARAYGPRRPT
ncbi:MAG: MarR family transcriptional regulator [Acidimicrobiia bacterium]|nr:MarR family transcriptional regulator [Acidimicrobiia bacterium]